MSAPQALLDSLPLLTLVVGKGGTGKTTLSVALATHLARSGRRTLVLSTDPAGTLGDAMGVAVGSEPRPVPGLELLEGQQLSAEAERRRFLGRWRDVIATIVDRGTYLDTGDISALVDAAFPGSDEIFGVLALAALVRDGRYAHVVADTAPTGHTLRLLELPRAFDAVIDLLDTMQDKHRFMVRALTHRYRPDAADELLAELRSTVGALRSVLADASRGVAVIVTRAEAVVVAETERLVTALGVAGVAIAAVVVNALPPELSDESRDTLNAIARLAPTTRHFVLPWHTPEAGMRWAAALLDDVRTLEPSRSSGEEARSPGLRPIGTADTPGGAPTLAPRLVRELTIVGGKGGVGKTSVSCALALSAAEGGAHVLLVSSDPAPSVADALAQPIGDAETPVAGLHSGKLHARQMDAAAAFERFRHQYESRVDALFGVLIGRGVDVSYDRAVARDLLALTPPGIDELYALSFLGETLADARFTHVVVDPAPTGHLLRLLEMPALALDWSHQLMRLMLKYKDAVGLGDTAQELVAFSRRTRLLRDLMRDPSRAGLVAVALDEPVVRGETERMVGAVRSLGVDVVALLWNCGDTSTRPLPSDRPLEQLVAPRRLPPPIGVAALREWSRSWFPLASL